MMFKSTDQIKFVKARSVIMVFAASAMLPIAASAARAVVTEAGAVSGGVFDCQGRYLPAAFACGRNIRFENAVVKDIPNNHALQIDGCENVVVTNCLFAGYRFGGTQTCLTRETIQVEQTSPGAIGNPETSPISCAKEISIPNRNVSVTGCWFGPSERLGPHLIALGHHGRARSCNGLVFAGNVVVNPLYCGVRLANVSDARVENNTFISTNATKRLADDSAVVCLWGGAALKPGEKGVVLRGNKIVLSEKSPLRRLWTTKARQKEVTVHDFTNASMRYTPVLGGYRTSNGDGEFTRPLYGWHGDDRELNPCKSLPWTSDRPKVALKVFRGYRIDNKSLRVEYRGTETFVGLLAATLYR